MSKDVHTNICPICFRPKFGEFCKKCGAINDETIPRRLSVRAQVYMRDNYTCRKCGNRRTRTLTLHHIIPEADGGPTEIDNLITLCESCHKEWPHFVDELDLAIWLQLPPASRLTMLLAKPWPDTMTAAEFQRIIMAEHKAITEERAATPRNEDIERAKVKEAWEQYKTKE